MSFGYKLEGVRFTGSLPDLWRQLDALPPRERVHLTRWRIEGEDVYTSPGREKGKVMPKRFKYDPP